MASSLRHGIDSLHPIAPPGHQHHGRLSALWPGGEPDLLHAPAASLARTALYYSCCRASIPGRPVQQLLLTDRTSKGGTGGGGLMGGAPPVLMGDAIRDETWHS